MSNASEFRKKIANHQTCVGTVISFTDSAVCEVCAAAGYDFVWIDMEHQPIGIESVFNHVMALEGTGTAALIRVACNDADVIKPVLDLAPAGVIIPQVRSARDASDAVAACRYPPDGCRGFGPRRGMRYGARDISGYLQSAEDEIMVFVQIEHRDAVDNIDEIIETPGLDGICIGPCDLSGSLNLLGQTDNEEVMNAIHTVLNAARDTDLLVGIATGYEEESLKHWTDRGVQWICLDGDWAHVFQRSKVIVDTVKEIDNRGKQ